MDKAIQHWPILQGLGTELANKVREFMVIGKKGDGVLVATEDGQVFWLGEMKFGEESKQTMEPTRLNVPKLTSMTQGDRHILLLDESKQIHAMGQNDVGQLGLGTADKETHFSPQLISIPHKFISVRCGLEHSLALTENGKVWAWGSNYCGQISVPKSTGFLPSPRQITELNLHRVVAVECGYFHTLALTDQGEVYGWGWNKFEQLKIPYSSDCFEYTPILIPTHSPVQSIAAGLGHTLLLTQTGEVWACGWNEFGQLGFTNSKTSSSASLVKVVGLPPISQIASHFNADFSIAMSAEGECFAWGRLNNASGKLLTYKPFTFTPLQLPPIYSTLDSVLSFGSTPRNTPCSVLLKGLQYQQKTYSETQSKPLTGPIRLGDRIGQMFDNSGSNPDVKFELGDQSILAHRSVLQISSAYFVRFFSESSSPAHPNQPTPIPQSSSDSLRHTTNPSNPDSQITPISIADHCYPTFHAYLHFLYTGTLQVPTEHLADLFELAHSHLESDLSELCLVRMRSTLSPENCCLFYQLTERHSLPEFQQDLLHFIADNLLQVFTTEAYQSMDGDLSRKLTISIGKLRRKLPPNYLIFQKISRSGR